MKRLLEGSSGDFPFAKKIREVFSMNTTTKKKLIRGVLIAAVIITVLAGAVYAATHPDGSMYATAWSLIPPVVAIGLALATKEVYSSLFIGIVVGALFYSGFSFEGTMVHVFEDGMINVLSQGGNVGILIFLVVLGILVCLVNHAGGSAAFGRWAATHIKSRVGAQLATMLLGVCIFVDDYFNCLTVGSVMRPVANAHKVSRTKLAYLIDSTAAPICIIAPISSWAAAVAGFVKGEDSFSIFVQAIPFNFYALLTVVMMLGLILLKVDYGPMATFEEKASSGEAGGDPSISSDDEEALPTDGKVIDLLLPILMLIVCCVIGIIYTGGFFSGTGFVESFAQSEASLGLAMGSVVALILTMIFYAVRRVMSMENMMDCIPEGFKTMVPAILILTFAWTLKAMTDSLGAAPFVEALIKGSAKNLMMFLPAIIFLIACFLAFATGTSWGTFGILIPIVVDAFSLTDHTLMIIAISACMAGAVCGDHCSPISDTTIMASAGAQCNHVDHVSTQLPYAITVAGISFLVYLLAGFVRTPWVCLPVGAALVIGFLLLMKMHQKKKAAAKA